MREILFRGKGANNGKWIEGSLVKVTINGLAFHLIFADDFEFNGISAKAKQHCCVDPSTIGQYTGLTDKNGKKIFEGDIIKTHYANAVKCEFVETVVFHNGKFCGENSLVGGGKAWATLWDGVPHVRLDKTVYMDEVEVIGDIHDNPELLEVDNG